MESMKLSEPIFLDIGKCRIVEELNCPDEACHKGTTE
jgi:hypothetical protein